MLTCMLHHIEEKELRLLKDRILQLKVNIFFVFTGLLLLLLPQGIKAVETFSRDSEHRGIVDLAPYQIYPENRMGNGIYLDKNLLDSHPQRVILNITSIKNTKSYVYLYRAQNGVLGLDIVKNEADGDARFWKVIRNFISIQTALSGFKEYLEFFRKKLFHYLLISVPVPA